MMPSSTNENFIVSNSLKEIYAFAAGTDTAPFIHRLGAQRKILIWLSIIWHANLFMVSSASAMLKFLYRFIYAISVTKHSLNI